MALSAFALGRSESVISSVVHTGARWRVPATGGGREKSVGLLCRAMRAMPAGCVCTFLTARLAKSLHCHPHRSNRSLLAKGQTQP